ncbi:FCD domain-containing protein [Leucobacter sp. UT-8R-CII-1-4]|uniref:FadR/GntR family transcriptional regulator n=1 Tax=Leucobacter sp. UT-8R-CII-1-4 TaxID=3040075 RepID=UPI0024A8CE66|nr:FCD domain-containing protein [Leucobacter sp. UT-8R-CII-1-4]MDI6023685.1 FCD domain-containing protein [Leucobacter sp. UT-8R-CII-1-4]
MTTLVEQLRALISLREYRPGERLPSERELATHFEASRPRVRRAIATLIEHGVLEARDRSGIYVRATDASELLAARLLIEPWAASEAATHATADDLTHLRAQLAGAANAINDEAGFAAHDQSIHSRVMQASANSVIIELYASLTQRISASRGRTASLQSTRTQALADLTTLVEAIESGQQQAAADAMRKHLSHLPAK